VAWVASSITTTLKWLHHQRVKATTAAAMHHQQVKATTAAAMHPQRSRHYSLQDKQATLILSASAI
jgi:hypothetical protein